MKQCSPPKLEIPTLNTYGSGKGNSSSSPPSCSMLPREQNNNKKEKFQQTTWELRVYSDHVSFYLSIIFGEFLQINFMAYLLLQLLLLSNSLLGVIGSWGGPPDLGVKFPAALKWLKILRGLSIGGGVYGGVVGRL